jgi:hypothetical protein
MTFSQTPSSASASDHSVSAADRKRRRHKVARRLYEALLAQDPNRAITLCDEAGNVLARHGPLPTDDGGLPHAKATCREDRRIDQN